ncbi:protein LNK1 isoform X2 [Manihot esculenta]|nr:protein LNK1 isoform X2 [Manihot esculenta]XP_021592829.1 protein LNK1 isoform X2 [Manihot esculenta]XP_021592830.1 protein LNK1 isoform X2 [Manihot esculenta]XP_043806303.1 protein LNK1 isoform X2 [Manihot esculenta]KAG8639754.1 hypothetical protein MANES_14G166300v8 [Manihot esculenta]KAG8639755.1 hypothetical protein MANES_14G166300v8 [Manihot esculenta]KAG8639757.1 hypothetical protein MANES_14G166300v8 [Manihot esculenta]OAY32099.1 hypothetical protein MANES_14G166300v8 [Manihot escu
MLDKGSWSHAPDGAFPASCDSGPVKELSSIASEETGASYHFLKIGNTDSVGSEFCSDDPILDDKSGADNTDRHRFPLSHMSQTDDGLNFFDNDHEDKENSDLLYYGWPDDIGNFEDVDRMFRSCDSTFGLGSLSNEDDLCWFSSSRSTGASEDALKLGSKFSSSKASVLNCISERHDACSLNNADASVNDSNKESLVTGDKIRSNTAGAAENSAFSRMQFPNGSDAKSVSKNELMLNKQINSHRSQARYRNCSEGQGEEQSMDNGGPFHHNGNLKQFTDTECSLTGNLEQFADVQCSLGDTSQQVFPPGVQQHKQNTVSDSLNHLQAHTRCMHMDYGRSSNQTCVGPNQSGIGSESSGLPSPSPKESSFESNQVQSMDSLHSPSLQAPAVSTKKRERVHHNQDLQVPYARNFKCANVASPAAFYDSVQNQACQSGYEVESHSEIEGVNIGIPAELDSSNAQESSCMSSVLDEISLEATSFRQLQRVMEQLDIRTKLCIRDSLYRLARSAEQRHNCDGGKKDDRHANDPLMGEETNKCTGFLDMETDTNPIDRSIAHLLFHRPSDPSVMPVNDPSSLKSHAMVHGSVTSAPMITKEQVCQDETASGAGESLLTSGNK